MKFVFFEKYFQWADNIRTFLEKGPELFATKHKNQYDNIYHNIHKKDLTTIFTFCCFNNIFKLFLNNLIIANSFFLSQYKNAKMISLKTKFKKHIVLISILLAFTSSFLIPNNFQTAQNFVNNKGNNSFFRDDLPVSLSGTSGNIEPPEEFFANISNIICEKGSITSGTLDSLKYKDSESLVLTSYSSGSDCEFNITFEFECDFPNFECVAIDYYDLFLYLDFETSPVNTVSLSFKRLTTHVFNDISALDSNFEWKTIDATTTYGGIVNISRLYLERTFKFRIAEKWFGPSKTINIDRFRIIISHKGDIPPSKHTIDQYHDYERSDSGFWTSNGYLSFVSGEGAYAFTYRSNWWKNSDEFEIRGECDEDHGMQLDLYNTMFPLPPYLGKPRHMICVDIKELFFSARCAQSTGDWPTRKFWLDIFNNELNSYESFFYAQGFNYAGDSINLITRRNLNLENVSVYLDKDLNFRYHLCSAASCVTTSSANMYIYSSLFSSNMTVLGYEFEGYDYPVISNISTTSPYFDGRIHPDHGFKIKTNITSKYQGATIDVFKTKFRIINSKFDGMWSGLSYNSESKLYESNSIAGGYVPEGYYDLWINTTDTEGHSTLNVTTIRIYNARPIVSEYVNPDEDVVDFVWHDPFDFGIDISDEESDDILSVQISIYEIGLPNNAILPWKLLIQNLDDTSLFEVNVSKLELLNANNNQVYSMSVKIEDERGFVNYTTDARIVVSYSSAPLPPNSGDDGGGGSGGSDTSSTVVIIVLIALFSIVGAIAGLILLKRKLGTSYRKDVKTVPKKFGKDTKFSSGQKGILKVNIGKTQPSTTVQSQSNSNVFQIGKKENRDT